jgi:hypothetical protein
VFGGSTVIGKDKALASMTAGLTKIIDSDTTGVMRELAYNSTTRDGNDFAAYAQEMLKSGQAAGLGKQMARLQLGNDLQQNPIDRLGVTANVAGTGATRRENAGTLGYFVGGVDAALTSMKASQAEQREFTTALIKSALTVVDKTVGRANPAVGIGASVAKEWVAIGLKAAANDITSNAETRLGKAALPDNPKTGELAVGDDVFNTFQSFRFAIDRHAKP